MFWFGHNVTPVVVAIVAKVVVATVAKVVVTIVARYLWEINIIFNFSNKVFKFTC